MSASWIRWCATKEVMELIESNCLLVAPEIPICLTCGRPVSLGKYVHYNCTTDSKGRLLSVVGSVEGIEGGDI